MSSEENKNFVEYEGFPGTVAEMFSHSKPWWPERPTAPKGAPNVVIVIADDLGYSDLGCYGSEIPTPNIDKLASRGLRYTNFHVTPLCSPTRAALMTGRNSHAAGIGMVANVDPGFPGYASELPANQPSMAETLRANGYSTLAIGKWHLCKDADLSEGGSKHSWPIQRGFEQYYGFLEALTNFHHPHRMYEGNSVVATDRYPDDYYLTDDLTDRAVRMIKEVKTANPEKPFFMYFGHGAVHAPLHAKKSDIAKYRGRYDKGWDVLRAERFERQKELGLIAPETELPPRNTEAGEDVVAWDSLEPREQELYARYMEVYAAMVDTIDQSVGQLMSTLEEMGELENTIFIFTSDNGASREGNATGTRLYFSRGAGAVIGAKSQHLDEDFEDLDEIGGPTSWPHYPRGWAMACNTPFRLYKITTHRGGHQVPFVMSWPDRIDDKGEVYRRQFAHITDLLPTIIDMTKVRQLTHREGLVADPLNGVSFTQTFDNPSAATEHTEQYWECIGNRAYFKDGWEAVTFHTPRTSFKNDRWELYNVDEDPTQVHDLAAEMPEKVAEMVASWEAAARENKVYPLTDGTRIEHLVRPPYEQVLAKTVRILPGTPTLERYRSSRLIAGKSYQVKVNWNYRKGDMGIVFAHGGQEAGYVAYVENGKLNFEQNTGSNMLTLAPVELGATSHEFIVNVAAVGKRQWHVNFIIDGVAHPVEEGFLELASFLPYEGIDIGCDRRSPVSWRLYEKYNTFPFSGTINDVTYIPGEFAPDAGPVAIENAYRIGLALE